MNNKDFFAALDELEKSSKLEREMIISSLEHGLSSALKKETGLDRAVSLQLYPEKFEIRCVAYAKVVEEEVDGEERKNSFEEMDIEEHRISLKEARKIDPDAKIGEISREIIPPEKVSRIAAQTASQVVLQKINDAKKTMAHDEMTKREGELVQAIVRRAEPTATYVEIVGTQMEAVLPLNEQPFNEKYSVGKQIKVYVKKVRINPKGQQQVIVSRADAGYVKKLFEIEVPEIRSNLVKIKNIVREAGFRTKLSVYSEDPNVDSTGACIGPKGARVNAIVSELNGEKVDVILYSNDPSEYITRALSPAKVSMVRLNQTENQAIVVVPDDKLSLAIGKNGQNAKLAARLTGYKIDIKPYTQVMTEIDS
ncbi:MAG: transcription termination factor NusA [Clostridia bacterium]|nr:transcription termination factor NusA [Clostridia bacterium]